MAIIDKVLGFIAGATKNAGKTIAANRYASAAYMIGGSAAGGYLSYRAGYLRNYYGDSEYDSRYGGSLDFASKAIPLLGVGMAVARLGKMDPFGLVERTLTTAAKPGAALLRGGANMIGKAAYASGGGGSYGAFADKMTSFIGRPGIGKLATAAGVTIGTSAIALNYTEPVAATVGLSAAVVGTAWLAKTAGKGYAAGVLGATALGGFMGYKAANASVGSAGEGNITDFRPDGGPSRRMNFSTAGLVQALHANRRG